MSVEPPNMDSANLGSAVFEARSLPAGQHSVRLARSLHSGRIAIALREAIIDQSLPAGMPLVEGRLAEQLMVSRGPVRSALNVLEGEDLVETRPNGRMVVTGFGIDDLRDLMAVRYELESVSIRWGHARKAAIEPVESAMGRLLAEGASTPRLIELDIDFHRALVELSGSRFLLRSWLALAPVLQAVITISNRRLAASDPEGNFLRIVTAHTRVAEALSAGDPEQTIERLAEQFDITRAAFELFGDREPTPLGPTIS